MFLYSFYTYILFKRLISFKMQHVIIVGNARVGKTSFIYRLTNKTFSESYCATIGKDMHVINPTLTLHDHSSMERYQDLCRLHYKTAHGAIVFFDSETVNSVNIWVGRIRRENKKIPIIKVLNKCDMDTVSDICDLRISCKENKGVTDVLPLLIPRMEIPIKTSPLQTLVEYLQQSYCSIS